MNQTNGKLDALCIDTIRFLAVDAVEQAGSGHPGLPLGAAPLAYAVWDRFLRHDPHNPGWINRDRFILSAGHGSALLYALLHVYGYDLPLRELQRFRQWESKTPGHPEYGLTAGVEATTGPLGQGFAMGVGMAMAERYLAEQFNRPGFNLVDHYTYALVSDGDLMEGVASEAASLAGTLGLGKLIYLYDDNHISIEGDTELAFREDVAARFQAYGWQTLRVPDGNDLTQLTDAIATARAEFDRPSLIVVRTHIGYGSPKQDSAKVHGEPLGADARQATKETLGWPLEPDFYIPDEARAHFGSRAERGATQAVEWKELLQRYQTAHPELAGQFERAMRGELPGDWDAELPVFDPAGGAVSTRDASGAVMNALAARIPSFFGGSADLAPSTKTELIGHGDFAAANAGGRNIHFGVREHAMGAIVNGLTLHGGVLAFGATFFIFSDYMRPALRLAALMQIPSVFVFTHDSIALGEDGPTHQPIEQLASLRVIPGLTVIRPADAGETVAAWRVAVQRRGPTALVLTRQKLPVLSAGHSAVSEGVALGAYIVAEPDGAAPDLVLLGSGSEVQLLLDARTELESEGVRTRVVSMPSWELFAEQPESHRAGVLPQDVATLAVEAGHPLGWRGFVGDRGDVIGLERFGTSAPGPEAYAELGFRVDLVVARALALLKR